MTHFMEKFPSALNCKRDQYIEDKLRIQKCYWIRRI